MMYFKIFGMEMFTKDIFPNDNFMFNSNYDVLKIINDSFAPKGSYKQFLHFMILLM